MGFSRRPCEGDILRIAVELSPARGKARRILDAGFFSAYSRRLLDINLVENPQPILAVIRTFRLAQTLEFDISRRLAQYVAEALSSLAPAEFAAIQKSHYGTLYYDVETLGALADEVQSQLDRNETRLSIFRGRPNHQLEFWIHRRLENEFLELTL